LSDTPLRATQSNISSAINHIDTFRGGGGTRLLPALKRAYALPKGEVTSRNIVIITDGYVSVEPEAFDIINNNLNAGNVFAFGIGSSVNRYLIEGMAHVGQGESFIVTNASEAEKSASRFIEYINSPVLTNIDVSFDGFNVYDVEPKSYPDLFASRPLIIYGKWKGKINGSITVKGHTGEQRYKNTINLSTLEKSSSSVLPILWARSRIARLSDYNRIWKDSERVRELINLGLTYNLLTAHTSFVAVDEVVRNKSGSADKVKQPLPLPLGVPNLAIGKHPITPEPTATLMMSLTVGMLLFHFFYKRSRRRNA